MVGGKYVMIWRLSSVRIAEQNFVCMWNSPNALKLLFSNREDHGRPGFCCYCPYLGRVQDGYCALVKNCKVEQMCDTMIENLRIK